LNFFSIRSRSAYFCAGRIAQFRHGSHLQEGNYQLGKRMS
jgi:hypothetical protein